MTQKANPMAIGSFIIGIIVLAVAMAVFFGQNSWFSDTTRMELVYKSSVKGLTVGAPVTIRGVKIGEVVSIKAKMYSEQLDYLTSVVVKIDRDSMEEVGEGLNPRGKLVERLLEKGLAAKLKQQSFLTGLLYVDVDFYEPGDPVYFDIPTDYPQFPTVRTDLEIFTEQVEKLNVEDLANKLHSAINAIEATVNNPQFKQLGPKIDETLASVKVLADTSASEIQTLAQQITPVTQQAEQLLSGLNQRLPAIANKLDSGLDKLDKNAASLQNTLEKADYLLSDDSPTLYQVQAAARELQQAAKAIRELAETLEQQPEAILYGKQ